MTQPAAVALRSWSARGGAPAFLAGVAAFAVLFAHPLQMLLDDWWNDPEAGHGLLLAPVAIWLAWRSGLHPDRKPARGVGTVVLLAAILLRFASELAAELWTMRQSIMLALVGLVLYHWGWRQVRAWFLSFLLLTLSVPLPELVTSTIALPLQFQASKLGAKLLEWRQVPVRLTGNIILLPGHKLFVTEACSGLRSLTALLSLAVLMGGLFLRTLPGRAAVLLLTIPVAIVMNGIRVFLTGFLVFFVDPALGQGFMHITEGWLLFLVSFGSIGLVAAGISLMERRWRERVAHA